MKRTRIFEDLVDGVYKQGTFSCSDGWMTNFVKHQNISLYRITSCQKTPSQYLTKIVALIMEVRTEISTKKINKCNVYACDERDRWTH